MASYNRQQIQALTEYAQIDVIAPMPWPIRLKNGAQQACYINNDVVVYHPIYYYTPRIFREQYGQFFYLSIKATVKNLFKKHKYDIIFSSWLYPDAWASGRLAQKYGVPLFVKVHGSDVNLLQPGSVITNKSLSVVEQAKKVFCVSRALKARLVSLGASEDKLHVLYNGVDKSIFYPMEKARIRRKINVLEDEYLVLFVGNLKKEKGLGELLAAFKQVKAEIPHSRLVIIGTGTFKNKLEQRISALELGDSVHFLGSQSLTVIAQWMNAASVLCLPSYMEGVPNVVLEAFACGTRVVATEVGGVPEVDSKRSLLQLVPPRDWQELARTLSEIGVSSAPVVEPYKVSSWKENVKELFAMLT
jgi:glycosyltransferase involved in cell wall biosynthesis